MAEEMPGNHATQFALDGLRESTVRDEALGELLAMERSWQQMALEREVPPAPTRGISGNVGHVLEFEITHDRSRSRVG